MLYFKSYDKRKKREKKNEKRYKITGRLRRNCRGIIAMETEHARRHDISKLDCRQISLVRPLSPFVGRQKRIIIGHGIYCPGNGLERTFKQSI